jgi:hypothetical protein
MEVAMIRVLNKVALALFASSVSLSTANAMANIVIQNKMAHELLIDSFRTAGSVVFNSFELTGHHLKNNDSRSIQIGIIAPECVDNENYVVLGVFNTKEGEYEPVVVTWGDAGIHIDGEYVVDGLYRASQRFDGGSSIIITFYDDESSVLRILRSDAISRLKINNSSQQRQSEATVLRYSGLKSKELNAQ